MANKSLRRPGKQTKIDTALADAEQLCNRRGTRLTALRRRVLEIILSGDKPQGAYAILDVLRDDGRPGAPPTVYRALDFLLDQGLIHRLASLNVFIGCAQPGDHHHGQFLICKNCGRVSEMDNQIVSNTIRKQAANNDFTVESQMVEVLGQCNVCQHSV